MFRVFNFNEWLSEGGNASLRSFSLSSAYERMCWVRACVHRIATSASTAPLIFYEGKVGQLPSYLEKDRITDKEHPAYKLFNPPKPPTINSLKQLMYRTFIHVEIDGLVFWIIERKRGVAVAIDIRLKDEFQPILEYKNSDPTHPILAGWQDSSGAKYLTQDVLAISDYNPKDELSGLSKLTSARLSLESEFSIAGWNSAFFKSGMKNPLLIQAKGQLTKEQKAEIKREILNYYSGIDGAHGALLMQGGVEVKPLVVNPKDIDFINGKKLNREEILAVFGVPPAMVGVFEYSNYCLTSVTKVLLKNNVIKQICDVQPGDIVISLGNNSIVESKVINCWEAGYKDVCTLSTKLRTIQCSKEHRFLRKIPDSHIKEWIQAGELSLNDEIAIVLKEDETNFCSDSSLPNGLIWDKVQSISVVDEQAEMFDLEIEGTHNYFANWMVTHNSNVREQIRIFWEHTLLPKMNGILELIQFNILDRDFPGVYAKWDLSDVVGLAPDPVELATPAKTYMDMGYSASQVSRILNCPELEPDKDFEKPEKNPVASDPQMDPTTPSPKKPPKDPNAGDPKPSDKPKPDNNNSFREQLKKRVERFVAYVPLTGNTLLVDKLWEDLVEDYVLESYKEFDKTQFKTLPRLLCDRPTESMRKEFLDNLEKIVDLMVCGVYK